MMRNLFGKTERYEQSTDRVAKDITREYRSYTEHSSDESAEMNQSTRHPGSYSREAKVTKAPSQSTANEQTPATANEWKERDRVKEADEKEISRLAYIDKVSRQPKPPPKRPLEALLMSKSVFQEIRQTIGSLPVETGGLLMGSIEDFRVTAFIFDNVSYKMQRRSAVWYPHTESLNERVAAVESTGLVFLGVGHSHPRGFIHPSGPDGSAAWSNMTSANNPHLNAYLLPIIQSAADGSFECRSYVATCHPEGHGRVIVREIKLKLID